MALSLNRNTFRCEDPVLIERFINEARLAEENMIKQNLITKRVIGFIKQELEPVLQRAYEDYVTSSFLSRPINYPVFVGKTFVNKQCGHETNDSFNNNWTCVICTKYTNSELREKQRIYPVIKLMTEKNGHLESLPSPGTGVCYSATNGLTILDIQKIYYNWLSGRIRVYTYERWARSQDIGLSIGNDVIGEYFSDINPERVKSRVYKFIR